jgi:hypothetical protein
LSLLGKGRGRDEEGGRKEGKKEGMTFNLIYTVDGSGQGRRILASASSVLVLVLASPPPQTKGTRRATVKVKASQQRDQEAIR